MKEILKGKDETDVCAFKGNIGHCYSASGILETILGLGIGKYNVIPGLMGFESCENNYDRIRLSGLEMRSSK